MAARRIAWLLNLDAELELSRPAHYRPHPAMVARIASLRTRMTQLLTEDDVVLGDVPLAIAPTCVLAFCPTASARARIAALGLDAPPAPTEEVLTRVNGRAFCAALGQTLPRARYVRSMEELTALLAASAPEDRWIAKRDYGFAGRERRRLDGGVLDAPTLGFVRRSFARGEGLQVEPWLARTHDFAQHGYLLRSGNLLVGAALAQECDARGAWLSSRALPAGALADHEARALEESVHDAGRALAHAGYFGPFGIDAYRYVEGGVARFQPRSEINARFSMGYPRALLERALSLEGYPER